MKVLYSSLQLEEMDATWHHKRGLMAEYEKGIYNTKLSRARKRETSYCIQEQSTVAMME